MTWNMLQYVILCSEALLAEGTGGLSAARVFHVLIGIITTLKMICNIFFLLYLHITEGTGIILVIWRWVRVLWLTVVFVFIIHFLNITVVDNTQSFVHDVNGIFLTNLLYKLPDWVNLVDFVVLEPDVDKQVLFKVVGTRREKKPPKAPPKPLDFASKESCRPPWSKCHRSSSPADGGCKTEKFHVKSESCLCRILNGGSTDEI